jgi:hypothetical protein
MGDAKIEMLEQAGYVWQDTLPGAFWRPDTRHSIDYFTVVNSSFGALRTLMGSAPS